MMNPKSLCGEFIKWALPTGALIMLFSAVFCLTASALDKRRPISPENNSWAFVGAKIYPSPTEKPIINGIVLVTGGKIVAVGESGKIVIPGNVERIDCAGLTLTAAFWNSHIHLTEAKWQNSADLPAARLTRQFQEMLTGYGFAYAFDTGSDLQNTLALRRRVNSLEIPGPLILTTGMPFVPPSGTPFYVAPLKLPELSTPEEAAKSARQQIALGADAIKLFAASPAIRGAAPVLMPLPTATAAAQAVHSQGKLVFAHPTNNAGIEVILKSGIDILAHTTPDGGAPWNSELVRKMRAAKVSLVPTLKLWKWEVERNGGSPAATEKFMTTALQQLAAYSQAGGDILFGTDVGYMTDYDPGDEYALMSKAGMNFQQILAALTVAPAAKFGLSKQTGRIAPGLDADIVLLAGDPSADLKAFSKVKYTFRQGKIIYQSTPKLKQ